jgi:ABC-type multidrug transport system ATPase subunit
MVATALLDVIAGKRRYSGHISLNGQAVSGQELRRSVAYVRSDTVLHPHLAVHNCLRFYAKLRHPHKSRGKIPMHEQVSSFVVYRQLCLFSESLIFIRMKLCFQVRIVTEELGLTPVLDTKVSDLTRSEYSRLLVAIQLLADAQILCIDHITHTMDIFDTFFLVEFLRQWASGATGEYLTIFR